MRGEVGGCGREGFEETGLRWKGGGSGRRREKKRKDKKDTLGENSVRM